MVLRHVSLLKAKAGEFKALVNTTPSIADRIRPLFEVGRLTPTIRQRKYLATSSTPITTYLSRVADGIALSWGKRSAMVDGYFWQPDAQTEQGEHVMVYMTRRLESAGVPVIPVVGYDRWQNEFYRASMKSLVAGREHSYCLRLDREAIDDSAEPEFFEDTVKEILDDLNLLPSQFVILIDFGDVTGTDVNRLIEAAVRIIAQLAAVGFTAFVTAGCSIPKSIELAVPKHDTMNLLVRREVLLWKTLRQEFRDVEIVYGDYGVRGPTTNDEIRSRYTNGKIRYTIDQQAFIVRGHPFTDDGGMVQMHELADEVVRSVHYLGEDFSWGDKQIKTCSLGSFLGGPGDWIAVDTNHHVTYAVQEVEEFERSVTVAKVDAK